MAASYEREEARIRSVLGRRVIRIEHVGSTSVPELPAKPIVDIVLEALDSADEPAYVPAMESAGYVLRIREPDWFEHRLFKGPDTDVNVHVFTAGCEEVEQMLLFRDERPAHRRRRPGALRRRKARPRSPGLEIHAAVRRREDLRRSGDPRPRAGGGRLAPERR